MSKEPNISNIKDLVFVKKDTNYHRIAKDSLEEYEVGGEALSHMSGAQSLNLIIGANNSGKSRFIRNLLKLNFRLLNNESWVDYSQLLNKLDSMIVLSIEELIQEVTVTDLEKEYSLLGYEHRVPNYKSNDEKQVAKDIVNRLVKVKYLKLEKAIYIPALRTAHTLYDKDHNPLTEDFYQNTLNINYPETKNNTGRIGVDRTDIDVFTGIKLYEEIRKARNSVRDIRERFEEFEQFLSDNFYDGKEVDVVALDEDGTRRINIHIDGIEENKDIHQLGDGIQAIIILMYKIFMAGENTLIVIDEPELHLHPGFQRIFMKSVLKLLKERNNNTIIFIVTHSNHLMDLTLTQESVSIYSFSKNENVPNFSVRACKAGDYSLLSELGVNSSSAFIANTSIWVEGPTDRRYLKFFLNKYLEENGIKLKEDIDYAFYEYGGSLLAHYDFNTDEDGNSELIDKIKAFSLANRIFLLADKDSTSDTGMDEKSKRLKILEEIADGVDQFSFNKTEGIEIENMLPEIVYKKYVHTLYKGSPSRDVKQNIESAISNFESEKIGNVLLKVIKPSSLRSGIDSHKKFKLDNGSLTTPYKNSLCDYVCETFADNTYNEIVSAGSGLDELIKELIGFINHV